MAATKVIGSIAGLDYSKGEFGVYVIFENSGSVSPMVILCPVRSFSQPRRTVEMLHGDALQIYGQEEGDLRDHSPSRRAPLIQC